MITKPQQANYQQHAFFILIVTRKIKENKNTINQLRILEWR